VEYNGKSEWVYWVLLLQAVPDVCNQFRRVGMGWRKYTSAYIYFVMVIVLLQPGFLVLLVRTLALWMVIYNTLYHRLASLRHALD
jgi:hypothetical protein